MHVKVVKLAGEFVWHHHDAEDELFFVVRGRLLMQLRDGNREVGPGELIIVPRGVEHCPKPALRGIIYRPTRAPPASGALRRRAPASARAARPRCAQRARRAGAGAAPCATWCARAGHGPPSVPSMSRLHV
ncbi:MAG TPA: cupin domain-containing protein [Methylomirabilota bacterium]|nr:cupin domain-containing protein [Methylomirabilota bacterium]